MLNNLILGLGNPGGEYDGTRHNVGFSILDNLASTYPAEAVKEQTAKKLKSKIIYAKG